MFNFSNIVYVDQIKNKTSFTISNTLKGNQCVMYVKIITNISYINFSK